MPSLTTTASPKQPSRLQRRVAKLFDEPLGYIPNIKFREMNEAQIVDDGADALTEELKQLSGMRSARMPAHLERLCAAPLLSPEEERDLFCRMNFCRYRASTLLSELRTKRASTQRVVQIEELLAKATRTRNRIIHANIRLVISIVKQFADERNRFDDLLSEGISCLIKAVDKFDFARGFRFSTYATRAVRREVFRLVQRHHRDRSRFSTGTQELISQELNPALTPAGTEMTWGKLDACISQLLDGLDEREKFIVEARYGFDDIGEKPTFQRLGELLGVSKERVRQIEQRALSKLREIADGLRIEPVT